MQSGKYAMVEFIEQPNTNINDKCVPISWIRAVNLDDEIAQVAYPNEPPAATDKRIKNNDVFEEEWKQYKAKVKYRVEISDGLIISIKDKNDELNAPGSAEKIEGLIDLLKQQKIATPNLIVKHMPTVKDENELLDEILQDENVSDEDEGANITLPPEYNPNDTMWTVKYRKYAKELVQLMPDSKVYVYILEDVLNNIKGKARTQVELARLLMKEVFVESALKVCSLTGKKVKVNPRPGLDKSAVNTVLDFVDKHGKEKGWEISTRQSLKNSMRYELKLSRQDNNVSITEQ